MTLREDVATMRALRAHLLDRVSMADITDDKQIMCAECKARTLAVFLIGIGIGYAVFRMVKSHG